MKSRPLSKPQEELFEECQQEGIEIMQTVKKNSTHCYLLEKGRVVRKIHTTTIQALQRHKLLELAYIVDNKTKIWEAVKQ